TRSSFPSLPSVRRPCPMTRRPRKAMRSGSVIGALLLFPLCVNEGTAAKRGKPPERVAVARLFSPIGTLLAREASGKPWTLPALYDVAHTRDELVALPGAKAVLELREGDV